MYAACRQKTTFRIGDFHGHYLPLELIGFSAAAE